MKKIAEILTVDGENSFFNTFKTLAPLVYSSLFGEVEPKVLDMSLLSNSGERYCSPLLTSYPLGEVVNMIVSEKSHSWEKVKNAMFADYDLTNLNQQSTEITNTKNSNTSQNVNNNNKEKVYTFDDTTTPSDTTENNMMGETTGNVTENGSTKTIVSGSKSNIQYVIEREIRLRKLSFINMVVKDTMNYITLSIY